MGLDPLFARSESRVTKSVNPGPELSTEKRCIGRRLELRGDQATPTINPTNRTGVERMDSARADREMLLLWVGLLLVVGVEVWRFIVEDASDRLTLAIPLVAVIVASLLFSFQLTRAQQGISAMLDARLPEVVYLDDRELVRHSDRLCWYRRHP